MKSLINFSILILLSTTTFAQNKGKIIDINTKLPIPFVNIQILGTGYGFTSDNNGNFNLQIKPNQTIVISAIGYETLKVKSNLIEEEIFLTPISYKIPEITINHDDKLIEVGRVKKQTFSYYYGASLGTTYMLGRKFIFKNEYHETPLIKFIEVLTDSEVEIAQFNVRLYIIDSLGFPNKPLHHTNILVTAERGLKKTKIDLEDFYIEFPKSGLFVAIQWLQIKQNEFARIYKNNETKEKITITEIEPSFAVENNQKKGYGWTYNGEWKIDTTGLSRLLHMKITLRN